MDINNLVIPGIWVGCIAAILILLRVANIFRYISNNQVGIVEKMWAVNCGRCANRTKQSQRQQGSSAKHKGK